MFVTYKENKVLNLNKTDYETPSLFLGQKGGLFDTINKADPRLMDLFRKLRAQDWDEFEFDFTSCNLEFKTCPKDVHDILKISLGWLWEADTIASRSISAITAPYVTFDGLSRYWSRVADNENLHAATYSEILRNSFDNTDAIIKEILAVKENIARLGAVSEVLEETYTKGHQYALGLVENDQDLYNTIYMFCIAMLCLERLQFTVSFSAVFAIVQSKQFIPIGEAVRKIFKDEFENHVVGIKTILEIESKTLRGNIARSSLEPKITMLIGEVTKAEKANAEFIFTGRELVGLDQEAMCKFIDYTSQDVYDFLGLQLPFERMKVTPLKYMDNWINVDNSQSSPQEARDSNYLLGAVVNNLKGDLGIEGL
ncbi:MAG: hypothetical protein A3F67_08040 [Verrucomicrobia bacterium RIFCSPHIGHO2_12_FULL_41_10]|nr:MAG: hypothetical protein A3F67_08040 [Verrucomicrobia bacterium RIFCSPHIGHO2_12_FULL_41_10]